MTRRLKIFKICSLLLSLVLTFSVSTTAFAASNNKYKTTTTKMTVYLAGNTSGSSNTVTFNFNDSTIPSNAKVTKTVISTPLSKHSGVNAIVVNSYHLTSPSDESFTIPVKSGNSAISYLPAGAAVKGTWSLYLNATCYDSGVSQYTSYSSSVYYPAKLTIYYEY